MARYIKPATEIIQIELQQMIAESINTTTYGDGTGIVIGAKPTNFDFFATPEVEEETPNTQKLNEEWDEFEEEEI